MFKMSGTELRRQIPTLPDVFKPPVFVVVHRFDPPVYRELGYRDGASVSRPVQHDAALVRSCCRRILGLSFGNCTASIYDVVVVIHRHHERA